MARAWREIAARPASGGTGGTGARPGVTLVEVAVSSVVMSVALAASIRLIGEANAAHAAGAREMEAALLADTLLSEIVTLPWEDPTSPGSFGPEPDETGRAMYDDLDDYHGYAEDDPTLWNGDPLAWADGWSWWAGVEAIGTGDPIDLLPDGSLLDVLGVDDVLNGLLGGSAPDPTLKVVTVYVRDPRGAIRALSMVRTAGGLGDVRVPQGETYQDLLAVTVGAGSGASVTLSGPLLELPETRGTGGGAGSTP